LSVYLILLLQTSGLYT